ncbi:MAG: hypothetical protein Q9219_006105 [cf. Caloplaca sp. 3 TL-2023]
MRFVDTETLQFAYVPDSDITLGEKKYAVLSHRWSASTSDEISFADIEESRDYTRKKGLAKLKGFCELVAQSGCRYGWIDTCCINKGDSLVMSEAINSMYRWYQGSYVCIIYLEDVPIKPLLESVWFDRGWTLQELIAPKEAQFYDRDWQLIGLKTELLQPLSTKTGIPEAVFLRLQRAIIQQSKDETIFAWSISDEDGDQTYTGLLAPSPSNFAGCTDVISVPGSTGFSETNGELSIELLTFPYSMETFGALLNCTHNALPDERTAILLSRLPTEGEYVRVKKAIPGGHIMVTASKVGYLTKRLIRVSLTPNEPPLSRIYGFRLRTLEPPGHAAYESRILSRTKLDADVKDLICLTEGEVGTAGIVYMEVPQHPQRREPGCFQIRWLKFGFDHDFNPTISLSNGTRDYRMSNTPAEPRCKPSPEHLGQIIRNPDAESTRKIRRQMFSNGWITAKGWIPSRFYGWHRGVSILKVDRKTGINGILRALNLGISVKLLPIPDSVSGLADSASHIWTVDFTEHTEGDPEAEFERFDRKDDCSVCIQATWLCLCGAGCDQPWIEQRSDQKRQEAERTKQLGAEDLSYIEIIAIAVRVS